MSALLSAAPAALADGTVQGNGQFERIKGRPGNYVDLYEWDLYLSADGGTTIGQSRRLGAGLGAGRYVIENVPAGTYTIYVTQPIFFARPKVVTNVQIMDGQVTEVNPELNLDYSCYTTDTGWSEFGSPWYQTFVATGTSIIRIQWQLAGWDCDRVAVSIHEDNGGNITAWPQVGPTKSAGSGYGDAWVGYRSGDIPTVPGKRYAVKLTGQGGSGPSFAIRRRVEDGNGYAQGQAYDSGGNPRDMDLLTTVFSDNDGTVIPYIDMTLGNVESLAGDTGVWGQTFRATGAAMAAVDCFTAGVGTWDIDVEFRIRQGGPGGAQVGPTKTAQALYQAATCGIVGVSYAPGEVPVTAGNTYFIEMSPAPGSAAFAAYKFSSQSENGYPYGDAYRNGAVQSNVDLEMTIIEYAELPTISRSPATLTAITRQGESPSNQTFTVANSGGGTLQYSITDNVTWLSVSPSSGSATTETDTITVVYSTASLSPGQHSATITISDPAATNDPQTIAVNLTVKAATPAGFYQPGWNLTSVPVEPFNPAPPDVFQDLVDLGNVIEGCLYRYEPGAGYQCYPDYPFNIVRGEGYWLWLTTVPAGTVVSVAGNVATDDVSLELPQGWSMIGHPLPEPVLLSLCHAKNGATTKSFNDAVTAGWLAATLYYWEPSGGYQALTSLGYGQDLALRPWRGYWIDTYLDPLSVIVPEG